MQRPKSSPLERMLLVVCGLLLVSGIPNARAGTTATPIEIKAHFEAPPDKIEMTPPCASWTSIPKGETCRGMARNTGPEIATGDMRGKVEYAYGFVILPSGLTYSGGVDHFTGTIDGCGNGSMVFSYQTTSDSKGSFDARWDIAEGSGTGDLIGIRGTGTFTGTIRPDGSTPTEYRGTVYCSK